MKIIHRDDDKAEIKIKVENIEDIWHVDHVVKPGDEIFAQTMRREKDDRDISRSKRMEKKPVYLGIKVDKVEYHRQADRLRATGKIIEGKDVGEYHTINIEEDKEFTIKKDDWKEHELKRLNQAIEETKRGEVLIISMDREKATFGVIRGFGIDIVGSVESGKSGKMYEQEETVNYHDLITKRMKEIIKRENLDAIVLGGPGFAKNDYKDEIQEDEDIKTPITIENTGTAGERGIYEVINRGAVEKVQKENRVSKEIKKVEKVLERISKEEKVAYSDQVFDAIEYGAVDELLIIDSMVRENEEILDRVEEMGGEVQVIGSGHESGEKLESIGGIAALLRFNID